MEKTFEENLVRWAMKILILEPFFTGSHAQWAEGYARFSRHQVDILSLSGHFWKWRMHGGAHSLSQKFLASSDTPDLILASDMIDLPLFLALTREKTAHIPVCLYFHENQLVYPWSPDDPDLAQQRDRHYAFINFSSARVADQVFFNSHYHMRAFFEALPTYLGAFPDHKLLETVSDIQAKSKVLHLGMDLQPLNIPTPQSSNGHKPPIFLWNHRWEYDKNPREFFHILFQLQEQGLDFQLVVLGEQFKKTPPIFEEAKVRLASKILHWGYAEDRQRYVQYLYQSDILMVSSLHDFFGAAVVEAIACGVYPLLPDRLAYPEHIPAEFYAQHIYQDSEDLMEKLRQLLTGNLDLQADPLLSSWVSQYDWRKLAPHYDEIFEKCL